MSRIAYVNGQFMTHDFAATHIEDRATQFGDGVYEVVAIVNGKLIDSELILLCSAKSLTSDVFPVPFGPIIRTKTPASYAFLII